MAIGLTWLLCVIPILILASSSLDIIEWSSDSLFIFYNSGLYFPKGVVQYIFIMSFLWGLGGVVESSIDYLQFPYFFKQWKCRQIYVGSMDTTLGDKGTPAFSCCLPCFVLLQQPRMLTRTLRNYFFGAWGFICLFLPNSAYCFHFT